jgi:hypothetical protein
MSSAVDYLFREGQLLLWGVPATGVLPGTVAGGALGAAYEFGPPRGPEFEVAMVGAEASAWSQVSGPTTPPWRSRSPRWLPEVRTCAKNRRSTPLSGGGTSGHSALNTDWGRHIPQPARPQIDEV